MLGSSFGSTNGASINPRTGKAYGPDFRRSRCATSCGREGAARYARGQAPRRRRRPVLRRYQAFQWSIDYPDFMDGIVPVVTAPRAQNAEQSLAELQARLAADPEWNGGHYYDRGGAKTVLTELRVEMLKRNGHRGGARGTYPDRASREAEIRRQAVDWAQRWTRTHWFILRRGTIGYDTVKDFAKVKQRSSTCCAGPTGCSRRRSHLGSWTLSPPPGSTPANFEIDSDLGLSAKRSRTRQMGHRLCAHSSAR